MYFLIDTGGGKTAKMPLSTGLLVEPIAVQTFEAERITRAIFLHSDALKTMCVLAFTGHFYIMNVENRTLI